MENILKNITSKERILGRKFFLIFGALCAGGLILAFALTLLSGKTQPILNIKGLAEGYGLDATIESRAGTKNILADQPSQSISPPYKVSASLKLPGDSYRDFVFIINAEGSEVSVIADGFHARDLISVTMNGETVLEKIPADWSGRLQLYAPLASKKFVTACVDVDGKADSLGLCHTIIRGAS